MRRAFFGSAIPVKPDSQGRIIVPEPMRVYGSLKEKDEVVLIGDFDKVELWKADFFEKEELKSDAEINTTFENVLSRALSPGSSQSHEDDAAARAIPSKGPLDAG